MYFAIYQALAEDERRVGLFRDYPPDFFDLIIVDECHRGSARGDSSWRVILEHFKPAYQLGMTATPLREDNRDTYLYFGNRIYEYSLRQGIDDGFLAPYRVHRVITQWDAAGWRPRHLRHHLQLAHKLIIGQFSKRTRSDVDVLGEQRSDHLEIVRALLPPNSPSSGM